MDRAQRNAELRKLLDSGTEFKSCPDCPDQGWHSSYEQYKEQVQCEFCYTEASIFNLRQLLPAILDDSDALEMCETIRQQANEEWAEDHTHLQEICKKYFPPDKVEGDSYGVPGIQDLADMLAVRLSENDEEIGRLRNALIRMDRMHDMVMSKVNHGASFFDADTIRELNEAPIEAHAALAPPAESKERGMRRRIVEIYRHWLKDCAYCGGAHPWATDGRNLFCSHCGH